MRDITSNEVNFILRIFKSPELYYNANSIASSVGITSMGALKIANALEKDHVLITNELGKARFFSLNLSSDYVKQFIKFLLKHEAEQASPHIKRWIADIKNIKSADCAIIFGTTLKKQESKDIDVLLIVNKKTFLKVKQEINKINFINSQKIHPLFQTNEDIKENIKKKDKVLLNAIKGIVVFGEDKLMGLLKK